MSIHVADDKKVIVKVPLGTPNFVAENFIREKKDWIIRQNGGAYFKRVVKEE